MNITDAYEAVKLQMRPHWDVFQASSFDNALTIANKHARLNKFKTWVMMTVEDRIMRRGYERWVQVIESTHKLWHEERAKEARAELWHEERAKEARAKQAQLPPLPKWL